MAKVVMIEMMNCCAYCIISVESDIGLMIDDMLLFSTSGIAADATTHTAPLYPSRRH